MQRTAGGEVSPFLTDVIALGDAVEVRGPLGGWFVWRPTEIGPLLLVGGGSGVVPLMAMIRARPRDSAAHIRLLYSVRTPPTASTHVNLNVEPLMIRVSMSRGSTREGRRRATRGARADSG